MMDIKLHSITIRELIEDFEDNSEEGVTGYGGRLNIRPAYQREFVYGEKQQREVINSIFKGFPLNVMYWVENEEGTYELLDGQQRTLSICTFAENDLYVTLGGTTKNYISLTEDQRREFLDYKLQVYICQNGTESEKIDWFKIINIAGEKLTNQELLNAVFHSQWVTMMKQKFSKTNCVAYKLAEKYMTGSPIRQDYMETVLRWVADAEGKAGDKAIEEYMSDRHDALTADREWQYFQKVIGWVKEVFPNYRKEMKGLPWGLLYNHHHDTFYPASEMDEKVRRLMMDDDVTNKKGTYEYLLSGEERCLSIRAFSESMKRTAYERQGGICPDCGRHFEIGEMEGDHITPWSQGGHTTADNLRMRCKDCNRRKSDK